MKEILEKLLQLMCRMLALTITTAIILTFFALLAFYCNILLGMFI